MSRRLLTYLGRCGLTGTLAVAALAATAAEERFDIARFQVEGNTLLPAAEIERLVAPLTGKQRAFGDLQLALEALEQAYRSAGYSAVRVSLPEQELTGGTVKIQVTESVIGSITISGNQYFDEANIRASLVRLRPGSAPDLRGISESIQLANDSPAKQISVSLTEGASPGTVDAKVAVIDNNPLRLIATLDNTGAPSSGEWRIGVALQHANMFNLDHVGTFAFTTSPDSPDGVNLRLFSIGYRVPLYAFGDSLDLIYGKSSVNSPSSSPVLGGVLGFTGKGNVYGLRWNHFLGRSGESTARLVVGLEHRLVDSRCDVGGMPVSIAPPTPPIASCVPYETTPLSVTLSGRTEGVDRISDYSISLSRNLPSGPSFTNLNGRVDRYSYLTPANRDTRDGFMVLRGGGSVFQSYAGGWQARLVGSAQYADLPLVASEQFGLVGSTLVRGFQERAVAADSGVIVNAEIYTPELAERLGLPGQLRALAFLDAGYGANKQSGGTYLPRSVSVSSAGVGLRYGYGRDFSLRLDLARVNNPGTSSSEQRGDWNAHLSANLSF
jgi:hemolysin activation/secretion protein